ncbi:hypothetical protein SAMN05216436_10621 [bacterium A37T11]|nr:hypothetical protein SAMN05216436_10621 [bacterium A37T11]
MDKLKKYELMEKVVRQLEDVKNSQQAIIEKIGKIEVDNFDLGDTRLEKNLADIHQRTADNLDSIADQLEYFADKTEDYGDKNNVEKLREQRDIEEARNE